MGIPCHHLGHRRAKFGAGPQMHGPASRPAHMLLMLTVASAGRLSGTASSLSTALGRVTKAAASRCISKRRKYIYAADRAISPATWINIHKHTSTRQETWHQPTDPFTNWTRWQEGTKLFSGYIQLKMRCFRTFCWAWVKGLSPRSLLLWMRAGLHWVDEVTGDQQDRSPLLFPNGI